MSRAMLLAFYLKHVRHHSVVSGDELTLILCTMVLESLGEVCSIREHHSSPGVF